MNMGRIISCGPPEKELVLAKKMRVAIFSDCLPERNGAGSYYHDLVAQLQDGVNRLEVFQPAAKMRFLRLALPLPGDPTQKLITPHIPRLVRDFRRLQPHLVISVTPGPFGLLGMALARWEKCGLINAFHTDFEDIVSIYKGRLFFRLAAWYLRRANQLLSRASDAVLINNSGLTGTVHKLGANKVEIMGTPLARAFLDPPVVEPRQRFEQVLFAGRLAPEKNLARVIDAARALPEIRFVIAGDGPLRKELEKAAEGCHNLRLTGWLDRDSLCREIDAADLLLLPSKMETFGTVALEAMARARPALVTENAGIHSWSRLGETLFTIKDEHTLAGCLQEIRGLPAASWRERAFAARRAALHFNRQTVSQWLGFIARYGRSNHC